MPFVRFRSFRKRMCRDSPNQIHAFLRSNVVHNAFNLINSKHYHWSTYKFLSINMIIIITFNITCHNISCENVHSKSKINCQHLQHLLYKIFQQMLSFQLESVRVLAYPQICPSNPKVTFLLQALFNLNKLTVNLALHNFDRKNLQRQYPLISPF